MENISGHPTYGYTLDWQNYINMTKWCAQQFPNETKSIAVRKSAHVFRGIFSEGKEFYRYTEHLLKTRILYSSHYDNQT